MKLYNPIIEKGRVLTIEDRKLIVSEAHDKPGRSACLLWESLFELDGIYIPRSLSAFLSQSTEFSQIQFLEVIPEHHSAFDNLGKGRMHDLVILAESIGETMLIAVEAKVDEPFDHQTINSYRESGEAIMNAGRSSNKPARIAKLLNAIFPQSLHGEVMGLKYQLLQAVAGTLHEAKKNGAKKAIFCLLNFKPQEPGVSYTMKSELNSNDLDGFFQAFTGNPIDRLETNRLYGPFYVPGDDDIPSSIPLYFLKLEQTFTTSTFAHPPS